MTRRRQRPTRHMLAETPRNLDTPMRMLRRASATHSVPMITHTRFPSQHVEQHGPGSGGVWQTRVAEELLAVVQHRAGEQQVLCDRRGDAEQQASSRRSVAPHLLGRVPPRHAVRQRLGHSVTRCVCSSHSGTYHCYITVAQHNGSAHSTHTPPTPRNSGSWSLSPPAARPSQSSDSDGECASAAASPNRRSDAA